MNLTEEKNRDLNINKNENTTKKDLKIFIVIAAYNEEKRIGTVLKELTKNNYKNIIVVNDGSKDNTKKISLENKATVLTHKVNLGQGAALRTGIKYSLKQGADIIVTFDGDGQHKASEIHKLIQPIINKEADVTLGSRFLEGGNANNIPSSRKIILKLGVLFTRTISRIKVTDTHNGFRALSRYAAEKIKITYNGMSHASEILDEISRNKLRFKEVPVTITYNEETIKKGQKNFKAIKYALDMFYRKIVNK